jgi:flagellar hook-length control protein FliK
MTLQIKLASNTPATQAQGTSTGPTKAGKDSDFRAALSEQQAEYSGALDTTQTPSSKKPASQATPQTTPAQSASPEHDILLEESAKTSNAGNDPVLGLDAPTESTPKDIQRRIVRPLVVSAQSSRTQDQLGAAATNEKDPLRSDGTSRANNEHDSLEAKGDETPVGGAGSITDSTSTILAPLLVPTPPAAAQEMAAAGRTESESPTPRIGELRPAGQSHSMKQNTGVADVDGCAEPDDLVTDRAVKHSARPTFTPATSSADIRTFLPGHEATGSDVISSAAIVPQQDIVSTAPPLSPTGLHTSGPSNRDAVFTVPDTILTAQVGSPEWDRQIGTRVAWLVNGKQQSATLTVTPPDLGTVTVSVTLADNIVHAHFASTEPQVRAALDNAIPQLREMLQTAGIELGNANVGAGADRSGGNREPGNQFSPNQTASKTTSDDEAIRLGALSPGESTSLVRRGQTGLIDIFA